MKSIIRWLIQWKHYSYCIIYPFIHLSTYPQRNKSIYWIQYHQIFVYPFHSNRQLTIPKNSLNVFLSNLKPKLRLIWYCPTLLNSPSNSLSLYTIFIKKSSKKSIQFISREVRDSIIDLKKKKKKKKKKKIKSIIIS